ncbi:hypothetical protein O9992_07055 [Vibrio lentus]|nr:hypothetical protein [Vibrio lentus]
MQAVIFKLVIIERKTWEQSPFGALSTLSCGNAFSAPHSTVFNPGLVNQNKTEQGYQQQQNRRQ